MAAKHRLAVTDLLPFHSQLLPTVSAVSLLTSGAKRTIPAPNGKRLLIHEERWDSAGKYDGVGWHIFRHTYRSWLDDTEAPVGVQQKLMRHAQASTTMNVYGNA